MQNKMEELGSFGAIVAAAACPICFPKLALLGAFFGLGALAKYEAVFFYAAQLLIVVALIGHVISYKKVQNRILLVLAIASAVLFFASLYVVVSEVLSYIALAGLVVAAAWMVVENRRCNKCAASTN